MNEKKQFCSHIANFFSCLRPETVGTLDQFSARLHLYGCQKNRFTESLSVVSKRTQEVSMVKFLDSKSYTLMLEFSKKFPKQLQKNKNISKPNIKEPSSFFTEISFQFSNTLELKLLSTASIIHNKLFPL